MDTETFDAPAETIDDRMRAQGVEPYERVQVDYFDFNETGSVTLPDGVSVIEFAVLNEGQRVQYLSKINRNVRFHKATGDAEMSLSPAEEKIALLNVAITGWNLVRAGSPITFDRRNLDAFLKAANPKIIDLIDKEVRRANPWLLNEMTVEDIDTEIANLEEMRATIVKEQEGKAA